jgi:hypothetical protein
MKNKSGNMLKGLKNKSPKFEDASMKPKGGSVNAGAVRKSVAPTPRTLGPRKA